MKFTIFLCYTICGFSMLFADYGGKNYKKIHENIEQKIVFLNDKSSFDMTGVNSDLKQGNVLPHYLKNGWVIIKLTGNTNGSAYVLLERNKAKWTKKEVLALPTKQETKVNTMPNIVTITQFNDIKVNDEKVALNELVEKLKSFNATKNSKIILKADKRADFTALMRAMDALRKAGFDKVAFTTL
jgi:hypothetical protein